MNRFFNSLAGFMLMALSVGIFSNISTVNAAFGTSPPWVKNDHLLPGSSFEQTIYLSRSDTDEAMKASVRVSGDEELLEWISIPDRDDLVIKKGEANLPMKVLVGIPDDAILKNYTGSIFVTLSSIKANSDLEGGDVGIGLGAHILVDLKVIGDEITDYEVKSVSVEIQEEEDPFFINVEVENKGNTEVNELEGQIDIYNSSNTKVLHSLTFQPLDEPVSPSEIREVKMFFQDYKLDPGEYWVAVKVSKDDEIVYEDRHLQRVQGDVVPVVVTPESAVIKEIPSSQLDNEVENPLFSALTKDEASLMYYILFGLIGLAFGLIAYKLSK